jgi:putative transposase
MKARLRRLPRLEAPCYRGRTDVHWTSCIEARRTGWLTPLFHQHFREILLHAMIRYRCVAPVYCLMPDHYHILMSGLYDDAETYLAMRFLRKHTARFLRPAKYQEQAYDHVLRDGERDRHAFETTCWYIVENPVRAGLCSRQEEYSFCGCMIPGYPDLHVRDEGFWDLYWRIVQRVSQPP